MAAVPVTITGVGQKITRNTQVAAQEDAWTITNTSGQALFLVIRPSQDTLYHSTSGSTAADGLPISGGSFFPIKSGGSATFYLRPASTAGVVDSFVVSSMDELVGPYKAVMLDSVGALTQGNSQKPTFTISTLVAAPTAANYVVANFESGAAKVSRLRRIIISNPGFGTAAAALTFEVIRTTAASSAGTLVTPASHDSADAAFSGIARTVGATITAGAQVTTFTIFQPATAATAFSPVVFEYYGQMSKAITVPAGVTNGLALRCINGNAGASGFSASMEFTDEIL
jgi:hypothetical protein